jgi:DNA-binding IclR family transcriptional regulator
MNNTKDCFRFNTEECSTWHKDGISAQESLALVALMLKTKRGGMVYASQAELSVGVGCSRQTLNKGLKSLMERGLVLSGPKRGQYQLTTQIGTKLA